MEHKLVSEDQHKFVVRHPAGHTITIAKAGLQPAVIAKIKKMPVLKMADGGEVPNQAQMDAYLAQSNAPDAGAIPVSLDPSMPQNLNPSGAVGQTQTAFQSPADLLNPMTAGNVSAQPDSNVFTPPADPAPQSAATPTPPTPADSTQAAPAPDPMTGVMSDMNGMNARMQKAIASQGAAAGAGIKDAQAALKTYQDQQAIAAQQAQNRYESIDQELQKNQTAVMNGKIDPNRLWNNAGTANKIAASIGLVLGGIGSALTNQPNAALQVMQRAIDRDIDAQKANMGRTQTLFSMNMARYKNAEAAEAATRLQLGSTLQAQLQMAGMKSQGAQAQANAKLAGMQFEAQYMMPMKVQLAKLSGEAPLTNGQGLNSVPQYMANDKDLAQRVVHDPVTNRYFAAGDADGAKKLNSTLASYAPVRNILNQLQALGTTLPVGDRAAAAESLRAQLVPALNELKDTKRISEEDVKLVQQEVDNPNNWGQIMSRGTRTKSLMDNVDDQVESMKKQYIPNYRGPKAASSFSPMGGK